MAGYECDKCNYIFQIKGNLDIHLWEVHDINNGNFKIHECTYCESTFKTAGYLNKHKWRVHGINNGSFTMHGCNLCDSTFKAKSDLDCHNWCVHSINCGRFKIHTCEICDSEFKLKRRLDTHKWKVHNINNGTFKLYECNLCESNFKTKHHLNRHQETVHDIGDKVCNYCQGNCFRLRTYKDKNVGQVKICNKCYKKTTGYSCRAEEDMVNYLSNHKQIKNYISSIDKIVAHNSCNTKRRPDVLISSGDLHIIVECDEKQHRHYSPICESGRIDEILDEFKSGKVVFIRWNPDHYKVNKGQKKLNRKERLNKLEKIIINLTNNLPKQHIKIVYMFYDQDNPVIVNRWNTEFVY